MRIDVIEFSDIRFDRTTGHARAICTLSSAEHSTQLIVRAALPGVTDADESALRPALFADAIRQMTRMPEFRNGLRQIAFGAAVQAEFPAIAA